MHYMCSDNCAVILKFVHKVHLLILHLTFDKHNLLVIRNINYNFSSNQ